LLLHYELMILLRFEKILITLCIVFTLWVATHVYSCQ